MKLILVVVAILGLANALPTERGLSDELQELIELLPLADILEVVQKHNEAGSFDGIKAFAQSENLPTYVAAVQASETWQKAVSYLEASEVDVDGLREVIQRIRDLVAARITATTTETSTSTKSLADFWADLKAVLPIDGIKAFWADKKENSVYVQRLVEIAKSDTFKGYLAKFAASSEYQSVITLANNYGFDLEGFVAKIRDYFGW